MFCPLRPILVPWIGGGTIWKRLEGAVKSKTVPDGAGVDELGSRHPAVLDHHVEQARADADISGGLNARQSTPQVRRLGARKVIDQLDNGWIELRCSLA